MIRTGDYRHRLEVQRRDEITTTVGSSSARWIPVRTVWGSIEPLSARELVAAGQAQMRVTHRIGMRYFDGLTPKHRIVETRHAGPRTFSIESVIDTDERHVEHQVLAYEGA